VLDLGERADAEPVGGLYLALRSVAELGTRKSGGHPGRRHVTERRSPVVPPPVGALGVCAPTAPAPVTDPYRCPGAHQARPVGTVSGAHVRTPLPGDQKAHRRRPTLSRPRGPHPPGRRRAGRPSSLDRTSRSHDGALAGEPRHRGLTCDLPPAGVPARFPAGAGTAQGRAASAFLRPAGLTAILYRRTVSIDRRRW
jgi:hypothetical protein